MESDLNTNSWNQYINPRDCSQGICSTICPQWCNNYINFSPPPLILNDVVPSNPNLSPLVIAIIGIFATGFLLVTYYTLVSKYCTNEINNESTSEIARSDLILDVILPENQDQDDPFAHDSSNSGLDDALIKKIGFFKFKQHQNRHIKINGTDCSICLGEFNQDDNLRLLPNCNHAFHVICIDRWLKSHSNCPLCRSKIVIPTAQELNHLNFERFSSNLRSIEENVVPFDFPQNVNILIDSHHPRRFSAADIAMPVNGGERGDERFDVENGNGGKILDLRRSFSSGELFLGAQGTTRRSLNLTIPQ